MRKKVVFLLACILCGCVLSLTATQESRFPQPSEENVKEADRTVEQLGVEEVFRQSPSQVAIFVWDTLQRGHNKTFSYYNSNPQFLTEEQASKPTTILLQSYGSNQGEWLPLLQQISEYNSKAKNVTGPIFTLSYPQESSKENLIKRIEEIKNIYLAAGKEQVKINLVGHSLGAIVSADYAYDPDAWVNGTRVEKVVSIAGRLKNIEPPRNTPLYGYCYMLLPFVDELWQRIETNRSYSKLFAIAAAEDWLVPQESVLVGDYNAIIPEAGHALIARKQKAAQKVIQWLFEDKEIGHY